MISSIRGTEAFRYIAFELDPGDTVITESGAMASMSAELDCTARLNGGLIRGLIRKYLGGESLFINHFTNNTNRPLQLILTSSGPGDVCAFELNDSSICLEPGSYICSTPGVSLGVRYAGISSFIAREGLFKLVLRELAPFGLVAMADLLSERSTENSSSIPDIWWPTTRAYH